MKETWGKFAGIACICAFCVPLQSTRVYSDPVHFKEGWHLSGEKGA